MAPALRRLRPVGITGEHSLTGIYAVLHDAGYRVESLVTDDPMEAARVNDRAQLAVAEAELRDRINERWMRRGVTMWDPERTYVDASVHLEPDVVLLPGVVLQGDCRVGAGAEVGPDCHLVDTVVGEGATVTKTTAVRAGIGDHARVGPFVSLGPGPRSQPGCRSTLSPGSAIRWPTWTTTSVDPMSWGSEPPMGRYDRPHEGAVASTWSWSRTAASSSCPGRSHPELAQEIATASGCGAERPTCASSPTARSTAATTSRCGAATSSSSRPTADR
jgi:hypothetical protein